MRFLHTSDWHLGRTFQGVSLLEDQAAVLDRLVDVVARSGVDAVLLAGDVYDRAAPPADAVRLLDDTLTRIVVGLGIPVVAIAGNHDSGERLAFGSRLLGARGLHVAGTVPLVVALDDVHGRVEVVAIPFAEPAAAAARHGKPSIADHEAALRADLRVQEPGELETPPAAGPTATPAAGSRVGKNAGRRPGGSEGAGPPQPARPAPAGGPRRIAVAHAFVAGGSTSESERPLVAGNAGLVPASVFEGFAYAALGHLHRPQAVGSPGVRYSGSLLKYSFDEASHRKGVTVVEIDAAGACAVEEIALPARRDVRILEGELDELLRRGAGDPGREDYVLARLSDRGALLDAMGKLRVVYPNCLRVDRSAFLADRGVACPRADVRRLDEGELFESFFHEVTGEAPDADEKEAFAAALASARRAEAEA